MNHVDISALEFLSGCEQPLAFQTSLPTSMCIGRLNALPFFQLRFISLIHHLIVTASASHCCEGMELSFDPEAELDLLVGKTSIFQITVKNTTARMIRISASDPDGEVLKIKQTSYSRRTNNETVIELYSGTFRATEPVSVEVEGRRQGRVLLSFAVSSDNDPTMKKLSITYLIKVVDEINLVQNVFLYVLCALEVLTLMFLGYRTRTDAIRDVFMKPRPLLAGLVCQTILMPAISLGLASGLALDVSDTFSVLLVGTCSTSLLCPMFSVLQHGCLELAIVLVLLQTSIAFVSMPLWLLVYRLFTSDEYEEISLPFYQLGGTLVAISLPLLTGAMIQRYAYREDRRLDLAIHTASFALTLTLFTVSVYGAWQVKSLLSLNLIAAAILLPLIGFFVGAAVTVTSGRNASSAKAVATAAALRNTLLALIVQHSSYPSAAASAMHSGVICMEVSSLCVMYVLYAIHLSLWFFVPSYRILHDAIGTDRAYPSIDDQIVKNMIKAGEISFRKSDGPYPTSDSGGSLPVSGPSEKDNDGHEPSAATDSVAEADDGQSSKPIGSEQNTVSSVSAPSTLDLCDTQLKSESFVSVDLDGSASGNVSVREARKPSKEDSFSLNYDRLKLGVTPKEQTGLWKSDGCEMASLRKTAN